MKSDFIKAILDYSGLSIKQFADKIHVTTPTVSKWKNGKSEPLFHNQKIIRAVFKKEIELLKNNSNGKGGEFDQEQRGWTPK